MYVCGYLCTDYARLESNATSHCYRYQQLLPVNVRLHTLNLSLGHQSAFRFLDCWSFSGTWMNSLMPFLTAAVTLIIGTLNWGSWTLIVNLERFSVKTQLASLWFEVVWIEKKGRTHQAFWECVQLIAQQWRRHSSTYLQTWSCQGTARCCCKEPLQLVDW